ncbi:MAG TPA: proline--tRNA ligase [Anaerolineaceae bacterium]|nr:proline--tRNA ligase [Anaerolineaceae bacterium]HOS53034.1 proline--tRNA ligase [Anaerolineaceae bacterium]HRT92169.1 proline--tRNA ligase [Anaerolineaceae bacterium]
MSLFNYLEQRMRLSNLFSQTLRENPADAEFASHQLLVRAGFIRQLGSGIFTYMPLAYRVLERVKRILREEMEAIGGQELLMPVVQPADIWKESRRYYQIGSEMGRFTDRSGHEMVLAMTHEEAVSDLVRGVVHSYRQLPAIIYHLQTKWRDDPRPRAGLIRVREFLMLDSYSLDADWQGLDTRYKQHYEAYFRIFRRCGLPVVAVRSDSGMMGGEEAHEYMYLTPGGEDSLLFCDACGYSANRQAATTRKMEPAKEAFLPLEKVATPRVSSIDDLTAFLNIPPARTAKAVFYMGLVEEDGGEQKWAFIFTVVRGDMEVNETKVANLVKASDLRPATEDEIRSIGAVPGYASPLGLKGVTVFVDELAAKSANLVAGANEEGYHLRNVNHGRDYQASMIADISAAREGDACPECGAALRLSRGVEVGNIFKLGARYSDALGCTYLDKNGQSQPVIMGSYGIGLGRLIACVAEEHHDERGLAWPVSLAPFPVHVVVLKGKEMDSEALAARVENALRDAGLEPLVDDREESAGVKFNDADLIGLPLRITVSERSFRVGGLEIKPRRGGETVVVPMENLVVEVQRLLNALEEPL